jgi:hypothetical protein
MEENKKLVRRYCEEVFDQGKVDLIDEFFLCTRSLLRA